MLSEMEYLNLKIRASLFGSSEIKDIDDFQDTIKIIMRNNKHRDDITKKIVCRFAERFIGVEYLNMIETTYDLKDFKELRDVDIRLQVKHQLKLLGLKMHINREFENGKYVYKVHIYKIK